MNRKNSKKNSWSVEEQKVNLLKVASSHQLLRTSSPYPSPKQIQEINEVVPESGKTILELFIKEQEINIDIERKIVEHHIESYRRGQLYAFITSISGIIAAIICALLGQTTIGAIIVGVTLISIVPHFFPGKKKKGSTDGKQNFAKFLRLLKEKESN
jgi:uncharacterized membrane protein